jgi:hypothetical protein
MASGAIALLKMLPSGVALMAASLARSENANIAPAATASGSAKVVKVVARPLMAAVSPSAPPTVFKRVERNFINSGPTSVARATLKRFSSFMYCCASLEVNRLNASFKASRDVALMAFSAPSACSAPAPVSRSSAFRARMFRNKAAVAATSSFWLSRRASNVPWRPRAWIICWPVS